MSDQRSFFEGSSDQRFDRSYALSGKIMLTAIIILFFVVIFMVCLHLYARWYLLRSRRLGQTAPGGNRSRRRRRGATLVFQVDPDQGPRGLDPAVLSSLPIFVYSAKAGAEEEEKESPIECAVCLSEFEDKETGRRLPKCGHSFHTECIDMWFQSHATCPLCRSPVESFPSYPEVRVEIPAGAEPERVESVAVVVVPPAGPARDSEFCSDCAAEASSAVEVRNKKPASVSIEVPARSGFGEIGFGSPASQTTPSSFRSPMSRMLSFTRILSRERRNDVVSPNNNNSASCSTVNELDIERGKEETQ